MDIGALISLASAGTGAIGNATGAARELRDLIKGNRQLPQEASELCLKIYDALLDAKQDQTELEDRLRGLQRELDAIDRFEKEAARYSLVSTPSDGLVYALKEEHAADLPHHYICPNCYGARSISILQPRGSVLKCIRCSGDFAFKRQNIPPRVKSRGGGWAS